MPLVSWNAKFLVEAHRIVIDRMNDDCAEGHKLSGRNDTEQGIF